MWNMIKDGAYIFGAAPGTCSFGVNCWLDEGIAGVEAWLLVGGEGVDSGFNLARSFLNRLGIFNPGSVDEQTLL